MEDFQIDIVIGKGPTARSVRLDLPRVHPRRGDDAHRPRHGPATGPLRLRRPPRALRADELEEIVRRTGSCSPSSARADGAVEIAPALAGHAAARDPALAPGARLRRGAWRGRDHPRGGAGGLRRSSASTSSASTGSTVSCSRRSASRFAGRPVGLTTLAVSVGEEPETIEDVYEPYLLQAGFVDAHAARDGLRPPLPTRTSAFPSRRTSRPPAAEPARDQEAADAVLDDLSGLTRRWRP